MRQLVNLKTRPSRDGKTFTYILDYKDMNGRRRRESLGHANKRKAERQRAKTERELRMGIVTPPSLTLKQFLEDHMERYRSQVQESTLDVHDTAMRHFIAVVGNIDLKQVKHKHGEKFIQARLDQGDARSTVNKKLSSLKRLFNLAIVRGQLDENPLRHIKPFRVPRQKIHIYNDDECRRLLEAARTPERSKFIDWELLIVLALCTGMRRGEILNLTWADVDFDNLTISVSPKNDTKSTWKWFIKDAERRTLPMTEEVKQLLIQRRTEQRGGNPYVCISLKRYEQIQRRRERGTWRVRDGRRPLNNFSRGFGSILKLADIEEGEFHDLRRTCLSRLFVNGMSEYDVMKIAGHSDFSVTHRFYMAVRTDLVNRARAATKAAMKADFGTHLARAPLAG